MQIGSGEYTQMACNDLPDGEWDHRGYRGEAYLQPNRFSTCVKNDVVTAYNVVTVAREFTEKDYVIDHEQHLIIRFI